MSRRLLLVLLLATGVALAADTPEDKHDARATGKQAETKQAQTQDKHDKKDAKLVPGMSILGNQEAPKSLVIVPWKSSEIGDSLGISTLLDDSRTPVDKDVFMRALRYYEIRSAKKP